MMSWGRGKELLERIAQPTRILEVCALVCYDPLYLAHNVTPRDG